MVDEIKQGMDRWQIILAAIGGVLANLIGVSQMTAPLGQRQQEMLIELKVVNDQNHVLNTAILDTLQDRTELFKQLMNRIEALEKKAAPK